MSLRAAGLIIFRKASSESAEYLLLQTSYGNNHWSPPKGHVDPGEDDITTALRETEEEAGIKSEQLKVYKDVKIELNYVVKNKSKTVIYWPAEVNSDQAVTLSDEHQDYRWLDIQGACSLCGFNDMENALREVHDRLNS